MSTAMAKRHECVATIDYSVDRSGNRDIAIVSGDRDGILQWAAARIAEMRSAGASSVMRTVTVKRVGDLGDAAAPIIKASFFDVEQGLSEAELYSARVHDWHSWTDRDNKVGSLGPFEYDRWEEAWGPAPAACTACDATLEPQNFYKYNGEILVRRDGTRRLLGV